MIWVIRTAAPGWPTGPIDPGGPGGPCRINKTKQMITNKKQQGRLISQDLREFKKTKANAVVTYMFSLASLSALLTMLSNFSLFGKQEVS